MSPRNPEKSSEDRLDTDQDHPAEPLDRAFDLIADRQRRLVLYYFQQTTDGLATFEELVDYLIVHEAHSHIDLRDDTAVRAQLHDTHIPKLAAANIVKYEPHRQTIQYRSDPALEHLLERAMEQEIDLPNP